MDGDMTEPKYMKRKVKSGAIELDANEKAIIVNYEVEATVLGDLGEAMQVERKAHQKKIRLKTLNENTNIPLLAEEIVEKCKMIHPTKRALVEKLLKELQQRQLDEDYHAPSQRDLERQKKRDARKAKEGKGGAMKADSKKKEAVMEEIDSYMEQLYEDTLDQKISATGSILELTRFAGNLEALIGNEALMGALSRTLLEEFKKSSDLVANIMRIFWSFSNFIQMHPILSQYKVGASTMKVVALEIQRYAHWQREIKKSNLSAEADAKADGDGGEDDKASDRTARRKQEKREKEDQKRKAAIRKQEKLLYVCFSVLLNLAEDVHNERKMVKKDLVASLTKMLDRLSPVSHVVVTSFSQLWPRYGEVGVGGI